MPDRPIQEFFPFAKEPGHWPEALDQSLIWKLGKAQSRLQKSEWQGIHQRHERFLEQGGLGGEWQILLVKGISMAMYQHPENLMGQAILERANLEQCAFLAEIALPFSNFCGLWAPDLQASKAILFHSIWVDAALASADFSGAVLYRSDFSRADLRGVSFRDADLRNCDFECSNLEGADFRGAQWSGARFPGAKLADSIF
ncbi:MAG: pentapeptide repeat-containing protein [Bacteroidota bacterium]